MFYHFAWGATGAKRNISVEYQCDNIRFTLNAINAASKLGCTTFIGAGSQAEYGKAEGDKIGPNTSVNPTTLYGISKYAAGKLAMIHCERLGIKCIWARIFSVYKKYDKPSFMISSTLEKIFNIRLSLQELEYIVKLHPRMFLEIYHQRFVNNIYFDSMMLKNYVYNVYGHSERIKVRIRWYGDLFGFIEKPVLELKVKNSILGRKESFPLDPFSLDQHFATKTIMAIVKNSNIPDAVKKEIHYLEPVLLNRYKRKYYSSADKNYRITID